MLAQVLSSAVHGIDAYLLDVEVDISPGLPTFSIVKLSDTANFQCKVYVKYSALGIDKNISKS
jgi:magnesium chelatase family protein